MLVRRILEHRKGRAQRRQRQRQNPFDLRRIDGDRSGRGSLPRNFSAIIPPKE